MTTDDRPRRGRPTKHGMYGTRTYLAWANMVQRCCNPNTPDYVDYGAKGVFIASSIRQFEDFFRWMGECPPGLELDRIDPSGPYTPFNLRWTTEKVQARNRGNTCRVTFRGIERPLADWYDELGPDLGLTYSTLYSRITQLNWSVDDALTIAKGGRRPAPTILAFEAPAAPAELERAA